MAAAARRTIGRAASGAATEQREAPGRELEGQVVMLGDVGNVEPVRDLLQKGRFGQLGAARPEEVTDIEHRLESADSNLAARQRGVLEQALRTDLTLRNETGALRVEAIQRHSKTGGHPATRDVHAVNRDPADLGAHARTVRQFSFAPDALTTGPQSATCLATKSLNSAVVLR